MAQSFQVAPAYVDEITFPTKVSSIEYRVSNQIQVSINIVGIRYRTSTSRGSFSCLSFSTWDETARLICGGAISHKYRSSTLVGVRHPEMALQAAFRTGSIFEACDAAAEKHRARAVVTGGNYLDQIENPQLERLFL